MIIYNCQTCKQDNRCSLQNDYARKVFFSFGREVGAPDCHWYQANYWHGIDGVMESYSSETKVNCH